MVTSAPERKSLSAASGSWLMFASAHGRTLPGTVSAPPMMTMRALAANSGSRSMAAARFVIGPVATMTRSSPCSRTESTRKSTAPRSSTARSDAGRSTSPMPLAPWMNAEISRTSNPSFAEACGSPWKTGTSARPNRSSSARLLATPSFMSTLPYVPVTPMSSSSGEPSA